MNNAQTIAQTLDRHLTKPAEVCVFGAGALLLDQRFAARMRDRSTNDIDIIVPKTRELQVNADKNFWSAFEKTNAELQAKGLYVTHIFAEQQVVLPAEWKSRTVPLHQPELTKLSLIRPHVIDLAVSKMGRGDADDVIDVRRMLRLHHEITGKDITVSEVAEAARRAHVPEVYREIFPRACERILEGVRQVQEHRSPMPWEAPRPNPPREDPPGFRMRM